MGKVHIIVVGSKGEVKPVEVKLAKISKIKWLPEVEDENIVVAFRGDVPFSDDEWKDKGARGKKIIGNLKPHEKGKHDYYYDAEGWETKSSSGHKGTPDLIVDGGEGLFELEPRPKKPLKAKKS